MRPWFVLVFAAIVLMATCTMARAYHANAQPAFGTYSQKYIDKQERRHHEKVKRCKWVGAS